MKTFLVLVSFLILTGVVLAANTTNTAPLNKIATIPTDAAWPYGKTLLNNWTTNTYREHIEYGGVTNNGSITFSKAFIGQPSVVISWNAVKSANASLVTNAVALYVHSTCFTASCPTVVATDLWWIATGICTNN